MDWLSLGIGGAVGAVLAVTMTAMRVKASFDAFRETFRAYVVNRSDPETLALADAFDILEGEANAFAQAVERLKRALRRR
jgi:hypothetical protein